MRKRPKPVEVKYQMDYVATLTFLDKNGESLLARRYHSPSHAVPHEVIDGIMEDLRQALRFGAKLQIAVVQDGAPELWNTVRYWLRALDQVDGWHEVLDWYHMAERLSRCFLLLEPDNTKREILCKQWRSNLKRKPGTPKRLVRYLSDRAKALTGEAREEMRIHTNYFRKRTDQMNYPKMRRNNIPIGSGVTEGACKSLITARAKRSGQRWSRHGLNRVLALRAIHQSERLNRFWDRFKLDYRASRIEAL